MGWSTGQPVAPLKDRFGPRWRIVVVLLEDVVPKVRIGISGTFGGEHRGHVELRPVCVG